MKILSAKKYAVSVAACVLLAACAPTIATHGNMLKDYQIAAVVPGTDTQSDILRKLGSPTAKAPFDDKIWYYMGQETEKHGVLDPKITKEVDYEVTFNDQGTVATFQNVTHQREDIPYSRDKTPTTGNEITVTQQLLGNLGRFNNQKKSDTNQGNGRDSGTDPTQ